MNGPTTRTSTSAQTRVWNASARLGWPVTALRAMGAAVVLMVGPRCLAVVRLVPSRRDLRLLVEHVLRDRYEVDVLARKLLQEPGDVGAPVARRHEVVHVRLESRGAELLLSGITEEVVEEKLRRCWTGRTRGHRDSARDQRECVLHELILDKALGRRRDRDLTETRAVVAVRGRTGGNLGERVKSFAVSLRVRGQLVLDRPVLVPPEDFDEAVDRAVTQAVVDRIRHELVFRGIGLDRVSQAGVAVRG